MLKILTNEELDTRFKSLTSSTTQAVADVQALSEHGFAVFLSDRPDAKREGINAVQNVAKAIEKDGGLNSRTWALWVEAMISMKVRDGVVSGDGKTARFRSGVTAETVTPWQKHRRNAADAKVTTFGFEKLLEWMDKTANDDRGTRTNVSDGVQAIMPALIKAATEARDNYLTDLAAKADKPAEPATSAKEDKSEESDDLFVGLPATSAAH